MPILSEAGSDRDRAVDFAEQFEEVGAKQIAPLSGVNRNIKLTLVSEAFMRANEEGFTTSDPYWHMKVEKSSSLEDIQKVIFSLLTVRETRELYGLTYRDFVEMDRETFEYITGEIYRLAKERVERERKAEEEERRIRANSRK